MDLEIFLRRASEDPTEAARSVIDAMRLEKIKQQRQSEFRGLELVQDAPSPETLLALEEELVALYGKTAVNAMRRHGFSGQSIEDRAKELDLSDLYNVVYRNFSRNVHGTDYMEHIGAQSTASVTHWSEYVDLRDHVALSTAITCTWQMATLVNGMFGCGQLDQLKEIWQECNDFQHWTVIPAGR
jgi:hypothetical protein